MLNFDFNAIVGYNSYDKEKLAVEQLACYIFSLADVIVNDTYTEDEYLKMNEWERNSAVCQIRQDILDNILDGKDENKITDKKTFMKFWENA
jgi:hypothetical protein